MGEEFKTQCVYTSASDSRGGFVWKTDCGMHLQVFNQKDPEWNQAQGTRNPICYLCNCIVKYEYQKIVEVNYKLCWQKKFIGFDYGWDDSFGTGVIKNDCSIAISIFGYWVGFSTNKFVAK